MEKWNDAGVELPPLPAWEAHREELLGIGAAAGAAHLGRYSQVDLERAVAGAAVPFHAPAGHVGFCCVERVRHCLPLGRGSANDASRATASSAGGDSTMAHLDFGCHVDITWIIEREFEDPGQSR